MKKAIFACALALTTLAVPFTATQQASAADDYYDTVCENDDMCVTVVSYGMLTNHTKSFYGYTKVEIVSGAGVVGWGTPSTLLKALKPGNAVVYAYDKNGNYVIYKITVTNP